MPGSAGSKYGNINDGIPPKNYKVLYVFIASAVDLADERRLARKVVDELNSILGRNIGWHIELLMGEDTPPGFGRPQALINQAVDYCDLFVVLFARRWGQSTGKYSSGVLEEFVRALNRRRYGDSPEIWIFFKQIRPLKASYLDEQLQHVLAFRKSLEKLNELYFQKFKDSEDWEIRFRSYLLEYVLKLAKKVD